MFVRFCAHKKANTSMANASVIPDGKAKNVHCATTNARWPIATDTAIVSAANANASAATKANYVKKVRNYMETPRRSTTDTSFNLNLLFSQSIVRIRPARDTATAPKERAFAKRDGKGWTVP